MGEEQGGDPLAHHPHLPPHSATAEADMAEEESMDLEGQDKAAVHTRLVQLQSKYDQQYQVRSAAEWVMCIVGECQSEMNAVQ